MGDALDFLINYTDRIVQVRWLQPFGKLHFSLLRDLQEDFEAIQGVEEVELKKYSAVLLIAPHVTTAAQVAYEVEGLLRDDPNLQHHFNFFFGPNPSVSVTNVGPVLVL